IVSAPVLSGAADGGRLGGALAATLRSVDAHVVAEARPEGEGPDYAALVFDATGIAESARLRALYDFFHPVVRSLAPSGRGIVLGLPPEECDDPRTATAQRAIEGFVRSLGKELQRGGTAQLVQVADGGETALESTLRFFLSRRSAYVSGQVVRVDPADAPA